MKHRSTKTGVVQTESQRISKMNQFIVYLVTVAIFVSIDLIWLGFIAKSFYAAEIGTLFAEKMSLPAAASFYLIYAAGLMFFAVQPGLTTGGWFRAAMGVVA
jgi:uncharacterized membrane protein